ncbi:hypothetical protein F511_23024 [Dorcoceras hygrometricum]|uniref:Uncharacterized protein n=1 Tax=Dorcoceras hygrometricum TaxID=472368 RepID=A0A2Z7ABW4_9LAMI|nr:hypothetical protein F511_23024 [Dorcoceras hygrometricum]
MAQASCENVIWNIIYEVCWKKYRRRRCALERYQELLSAMMKVEFSNHDISVADEETEADSRNRNSENSN